MSFLGEIKRRKVFQVAAVYAVMAWLIIQIIDVVSEPLNLPDWLDTVVIVLLAVGFPIGVVLAWAFDLTSQGVVRDRGSDDVKESNSRRLELILGGFLVIAVAWIGFRELNPPASDLDLLPNSVAVLPFANLSPDPDNAYFALGIHDTILHELSKIADMNVIARASVLRYSDSQIPVAQIAEELNVETIMEGTVQYAEDQVRITAQLIDPETGSHLWSGNYDRDFADIFEIQSEIATRIATALQAELLPEEQESIERPLAISSEAFAFYLRAIALLQEESARFEIRPAVIAYLDEAIRLDPNFSLAYGLRAHLYSEVSLSDSSRREELQRLARQDADTALRLDPATGLAHIALAEMYENNWQRQEAQQAFERAIEASPNDPEVLREYALFKAQLGQFEDAVDLAEAGIRLNPYASIQYTTLGRVYLMSRDLDQAASSFRRNEDRNVFGLAHLAMVEVGLGHYELAQRELEAIETTDEINWRLRPNIAYTYGRLGRRAEAERILEEFESIDCLPVDCPIEWAVTHLARGQSALAIERLQTAIEHLEAGRYDRLNFGMSMLLVANSWSDPVLDQTEFSDLRSRLELR